MMRRHFLRSTTLLGLAAAARPAGNDGSPASAHAGKRYWFCMPSHKKVFDAAPAAVLGEAR